MLLFVSKQVKFFAVKKIYKHIQRYSTKMLVHGNVYLERPLKMWKTKLRINWN